MVEAVLEENGCRLSHGTYLLSKESNVSLRESLAADMVLYFTVSENTRIWAQEIISKIPKDSSNGSNDTYVWMRQVFRRR